MKATDDGHQFTSSKIVLLDCNSKQVHDLTSPSEMGMNPSASAEAGRIVYSTVEGKLFMLELNVKILYHSHCLLGLFRLASQRYDRT